MKRLFAYLSTLRSLSVVGLIGLFAYSFIGLFTPALAAVYTGGPITVTKTVLNPTTEMFVHSLSLNDPMYKPQDTVSFHITVSNASNETFNNVTVQDVFPDYVSFVSGTGNFDKNAKTLTFIVNDLKSNTTQTFTVQGQIADANSLPTNQGSICAANRVLVQVNGVQAAHDSSSFCIQKIYAPSQATTTPSTGPEALPLLGLLTSGAFGFFLRRKK